MTAPIKKASLNTLLSIVQCGGGMLSPRGSLVLAENKDDFTPPNVWATHDQAEDEIKRRFRRLKQRIEELKQWNR